MKVGLNLVFSNPGHVTDQELWREQLAQADQAEPLGFDSVWGVEHHFTDYIICPDVLQYLTWIAARTEEIELGSQVVVLPWHDPLRVAEQPLAPLAQVAQVPLHRDVRLARAEDVGRGLEMRHVGLEQHRAAGRGSQPLRSAPRRAHRAGS